MDYQPLTKQKAAEVLSVSKRTIENWISDGTLPPPHAIGRRVYWHPRIFYAWLDTRLGAASPTDGHAAGTRKRGRPRNNPAI